MKKVKRISRNAKEVFDPRSVIRQTPTHFVGKTSLGRIRIGELSIRCVTSDLPVFHEYAVGCLHLTDAAFNVACALYMNEATLCPGVVAKS